MKSQPLQARWITRAVLGMVVLVTGCETVERYSLTYKLWNDGDFRNYCQPAPKPNLALFSDAFDGDVLVEYDALSDKHSAIERRAYFLEANRSRVGAGRKPKFVDLAMASGMKPIPVLDCGSAITNSLPWFACYPFKAEGGPGFKLHRMNGAESIYELPVYLESFGTPTRVVLTPFAVLGDTVMAGAVASAMAFLVWVSGGAIGANVH